MTPAEMDAVVEQSFGQARGLFRRELEALEHDLRPDERLLAMAGGSPGLLTGGATIFAATDQRLVAVGPASGCETIEYDALISVTDDLADGELALVTRDRVLTLAVCPTPGMKRLSAAVKARIGGDRLHKRAGAAEYRGAQETFVRGVICAVLIVTVYLLVHGATSLIDRWREDRRTPDRLERGACLDVEGGLVACDVSKALYVIRGPKDMPSCSSASPTLVRSIAIAGATRGELSRWCVGVNTRKR